MISKIQDGSLCHGCSANKSCTSSTTNYSKHVSQQTQLLKQLHHRESTKHSRAFDRKSRQTTVLKTGTFGNRNSKCGLVVLSRLNNSPVVKSKHVSNHQSVHLRFTTLTMATGNKNCNKITGGSIHTSKNVIFTQNHINPFLKTCFLEKISQLSSQI